MKKLLVLAAALLILMPASAMAGMTAFMDMDELSNTELAGTTGQAGLTLETTVRIVTGGYIGWGDDDGCTGTVSTTNAGWLTLSSVWVNSIAQTITVDVCNDGTNEWLTIALPAITVSAGVRAIKVGSTKNTDDSMGEIWIQDLSIAGSTLRVRGH